VKETTFFLVVVLLIRSFNVFGQVNVLTGGGPMNETTTIIHQVYLRAFSDYRFGYACAMSFVVLVIVGIITLLNFKYGRTAYEREQ
jgi:ABC-type sugar transport system permease subunit